MRLGAAFITIVNIFVMMNYADALEPQIITNSIGMRLVLIPKGTFIMGSPVDEKGSTDEETQHQVTISRDYFLGMTEVTQSQFEKVMQKNPSYFSGDRMVERHPDTNRIVKRVNTSDYPVENVSWEDAAEFCKRLSAMPEEKAAGRVYGLPTEAEWEYACRSGSRSAFAFSNTHQALGSYAWFSNNSEGKSHLTATKKPNAWELFDMHGNVSEWCADGYRQYPTNAVKDPLGPDDGMNKVIRGGNWEDTFNHCRSAYRIKSESRVRSNSIGFRVSMNSRVLFGEVETTETVQGKKVRTGDPQFTLTWDTDADLDLHVIEPGGNEIYWEYRKGKRGELDVDDVDGQGPENVYWKIGLAPTGEYGWYVHYYGGFGGRVRPTKWQLRVKNDGKVEIYEGLLDRIDARSPKKFIRHATDPDG